MMISISLRNSEYNSEYKDAKAGTVTLYYLRRRLIDAFLESHSHKRCNDQVSCSTIPVLLMNHDSPLLILSLNMYSAVALKRISKYITENKDCIARGVPSEAGVRRYWLL